MNLIWISAVIVLILILVALNSLKRRWKMEMHKDKIIAANKRGGWRGDKPPTEFGPFRGVYLEDIPRTVMKVEDFAKIVKQTIGTDTPEKRTLVRSIIAIAIREQRIGGLLQFPDHNPFGFNAWPNRWKSIRKYINGIFLAKDKKGWIWFLSFPSLRDAILAIATVLQARGFHQISSGEEFARYYVWNWWSPEDKEKALSENRSALARIWEETKKYVA
jgi:hypothetical protein